MAPIGKVCNDFSACTDKSPATNWLPQLDALAKDNAWVWIEGFVGDGTKQFVYDSAQQKFLLAEMSESQGKLVAKSPQVELNPVVGQRLYTSIAGQRAIGYNASSATLLSEYNYSFDKSDWKPTINLATAQDFYMGQNSSISMWLPGGKGVHIRRSGSGYTVSDYDVTFMTTKVVTPGNHVELGINESTIVEDPWDPSNKSNFKVRLNPNESDFGLLEYNVVKNAPNDAIKSGDPITQSQYYLRIHGTQTFVNCIVPEDPQNPQPWEIQQYLRNQLNGKMVMPGSPVFFEPIQLCSNRQITDAVDPTTCSSVKLAYDGHGNFLGLQDPFRQLQQNDDITVVKDAMKIVPDGTVLTDELTSIEYVAFCCGNSDLALGSAGCYRP